MSLCKSGQISNCCLPNALMTLKEYLEDYEDIADAINYGWYNPNKSKDKSDDFEMDR